MKPSLHAKVSELVMGWAPYDAASKYWWVKPGRRGLCGGNPYCQQRRPDRNWRPTHDMNHTLEVVARMRALGYSFRSAWLQSSANDLWVVEFRDHEDRAEASAPSLPWAICTAAVEALTTDAATK